MWQLHDISEDETPPEDIRLKLGLAAHTHKAWRQRRRRQQKGDLLPDYLRHAAELPYYAARLYGHTHEQLDLESFPILTRDAAGAATTALTASIDGNSPFVWTNGTLLPAMKVFFDAATWYDFNYAVYDEFAKTIPALVPGSSHGEVSVVLLTDIPDKRRTSVIVPCLKSAILRRLRVGRTLDEDIATAYYLRVHKIPLLYAKPATLLDLVRIDRRLERNGNERIHPDAVFVSGEPLYDDDRTAIETWFECHVYNAYISTECGLIAVECRHRHGLHIQKQRVVVEVLGSDGSVRREGRGRILVTNFVNWAHAFVRYDLGDYVDINAGRCACGYEGQTIGRLGGHEPLEFETACGSIDTAEFEGPLTKLGLHRYQLVQLSPDSFILKWVPTEEQRAAATCEAWGRRITSTLKSCQPCIQFSCEAASSLRPPGGKLRRFIVKAASAVP